MNRNGLVSVILPTYNRGHVLTRAINSVLAQTYPQWELIIVDDGSTDKTVYLIAEYTTEDPRIVYVFQRNLGPSAGRNYGLRIAAGAYHTFLDSDDEYLPRHLELRMQFMKEHPDAEFLHGGAHVIGSLQQQYVPDKDNPEKLVSLSDCVIGGTFFSKAGIIAHAGGWRPGYAEDADLFNRVRSHATVYQVPYETYLYHRDSPDSRCTDTQNTE